MKTDAGTDLAHRVIALSGYLSGCLMDVMSTVEQRYAEEEKGPFHKMADDLVGMMNGMTRLAEILAVVPNLDLEKPQGIVQMGALGDCLIRAVFNKTEEGWLVTIERSVQNDWVAVTSGVHATMTAALVAAELRFRSELACWEYTGAWGG